jgi:creatinine amidohydrolase/Fe(II)-dependent formamide hydrolase-like protein
MMKLGKSVVLFVILARVVFAGSPGRFTELGPADLKHAIARHPVAFVPAGICEWHGEQSACGLDALKAETLCEMAAERLGGVCFPTVWLGPDGTTPFDPTKYPRGTVSIDKAKYDSAAEQILTDIEAMGFKVAVYLSGHYPGVIPDVAAKFNQRGRMKVISISENQVVEGMPAGDHAGAWETSVLMVLRPGLVDLTKLPPLPATTQPAGEVIPPKHEFRQRTELYGIYQLDPRVWANAHYGRRGVEAVIDGLAREVGKALDDSNYGTDRKPTDRPKDDSVPLAARPTVQTRAGEPPVAREEVRYDHLLPCQWMERFEGMPVVYVPLAPADGSLESTTARAIEWAQATGRGGMVFPAISYGPSAADETPAIAGETYAAIVSEIVADLADMDFGAIVLVTSPNLSPDLRERLAAMSAADGQYTLAIVSPESPRPAERAAALSSLIPREGREVDLKSSWRVNGRDVLYSLAEDVYGPGDTRVYEYELTCGPDDGRMAALLDLGQVRNRAEVVVNDGPALSDHWPPYRFTIGGMLRPGPNLIKITVKNEPQPTLDPFFHQPGLPRLRGPVKMRLWNAGVN